MWFSVYVTALMRALWGEEQKEKEEVATTSEGAFMEMTEFFFDLINKIQLRQAYILLACLFPLPHILHQARLQQGKSWRRSARGEATPAKHWKGAFNTNIQVG